MSRRHLDRRLDRSLVLLSYHARLTYLLLAVHSVCTFVPESLRVAAVHPCVYTGQDVPDFLYSLSKHPKRGGGRGRGRGRGRGGKGGYAFGAADYRTQMGGHTHGGFSQAVHYT